MAGSAFASGSVSLSGGALAFTAGASDGANDVTLDYSSFTYVITDSVAVNAGTGCTQVNSTTVNCASTLARAATLNLGDGLDDSTVTANVPSGGRVTINGDASGGGVSAASAVVPIHVNSIDGMFYTGSGPDVLVVGDADYDGEVFTNGGADSVTVTTDNDPVAYDPLYESTPYAATNATNSNMGWPVEINGGAGPDYIDASSSAGGVYYNYGTGCDFVLGGQGNDFLIQGIATSEDDTIHGLAGNDKFYSYDTNAGDDMNYGGPGNDTFIVRDNNAEELFDGGTGTDVVIYESGNGTAARTLTLDGVRDDGAAGNDDWTSTVERAYGSLGGGVTSVGNASDNWVYGDGSADTLTGGLGVDSFDGKAGNDTIHSYDGLAETVTCGSGTDTVDADTTDTLSGCENVTTH